VNKQNNVSVIYFIQFHARFSSREGCEGSSPRRTCNVSRPTAISDGSAGSTPRRDPARLEMKSLHLGLWTTSEPLFRGFSQQKLPRQSFVGHSGKWPNQYICAPSIRRSGSTFKALRISQLRTLSRSVTPGLFEKIPSLPLSPEIILFRSLPKIQDHR